MDGDAWGEGGGLRNSSRNIKMHPSVRWAKGPCCSPSFLQESLLFFITNKEVYHVTFI